MGRRDPRITAYINAAAPFARPVLRHLRGLIHRACPEIEETMKWGMPHFTLGGILCSMAAFKAHCALGFWLHDQLLAENGPRTRDSMGSFGRITSLEDLPSDPTLRSLITKAAALTRAGARKNPTPRTARSAPVRIPAPLAAALAANAAALAHFDAMAPSHRREYAEWIAEAKRPETVAKRVASAVEWLEQGKSRHRPHER